MKDRVPVWRAVAKLGRHVHAKDTPFPSLCIQTSPHWPGVPGGGRRTSGPRVEGTLAEGQRVRRQARISERLSWPCIQQLGPQGAEAWSLCRARTSGWLLGTMLRFPRTLPPPRS